MTASLKLLKNFTKYFEFSRELLKVSSKIRLLKVSSNGFEKEVMRLPDTYEQVVRNIDLAVGYFMLEQKKTAGQMADLLGMSANTLRWKREGKSDWTWSEMMRLSELLGKTPDEIAGISAPVGA